MHKENRWGEAQKEAGEGGRPSESSKTPERWGVTMVVAILEKTILIIGWCEPASSWGPELETRRPTSLTTYSVSKR